MKKVPTIGPEAIAPDITLIVGKDRVTVSRIRSGHRFAFRLRDAARLMANNAHAVTSEEPLELQPLVIAAVILAYSFLEAGLNEFIFLNATASKSPLSDTEKAIIQTIRSEDLRPRRQNTLQLFNTMLRILRKEELATAREPYRAADAVRALRNLLVHPRPELGITTFSNDPNEDLSRQQPIARQLRQYLNLDRSATFPPDVLTSKCAGWAVRACESFFAEFVKRSGVDPGFLTDQ